MVNRRHGVLTALLLASKACAQVTSVVVTSASTAPASTATLAETLVFTCPPIPTVFVNVTQYVPVTDLETTTAIQPVTIYQTVLATTVLTSTATEIVTAIVVDSTTATDTDTVTATATTATTATATDLITQTSITVSPTTATATEEIFPYTITQKVTSITLCPTRLVNPTYTAAQPYPTEWLWGCPPGWLCRPEQADCNMEVGLPDRDFKCSPNECIPAEAIIGQLPVWGDINETFTPAQLAGLNIQSVDDYFNMDPLDFGLTYEIFVRNEEITLTSTVLQTPTPVVGARQAQTSIPGACYPWCNNCLLEAQSSGKTPALCIPGTAFLTDLAQCESCINIHKSDGQGTFVQIAPQFQQFLDYCDQYTTTVVTTSSTATVVMSGGTTATSVTSSVSTTVTPKSSVAAATSSAPADSTTTTATSAMSPKTTVSTIIASTITESVATLTTTSYVESTVTGAGWSGVTIVMPYGNNSSTTVYGSNISNNATLVLPIAQTTWAYTTTMTGDQVSPATTTSTPPAVPATYSGSGSSGNSSGGVKPSTYTGSAASNVRTLGADLYWKTILLGMVLSVVFAISL